MGIELLNLALIIPAAGLSSRQPPNKLLLGLDERSVIEQTISNLVDFPGEIYLVLGYMAEEILALIEPYEDQVNIVMNPDFESGLSSSIKIGVDAAGSDLDYWCFCPGDKPFITLDTFYALFYVLRETMPDILIPRFKQHPGHPTFFSTLLKDAFRELEGDAGGRQIISRTGIDPAYVDVQEEGIIMDMDRYLEEEHG